MTAVPLTGAETTPGTEPFQALPADRGVAQFSDMSVELLVTFIAGMAGLAFGRILGIDVVGTGVTVASAVGVAVVVYNRVWLVGRQGRSLGRVGASIAVLDKDAFAPIGVPRALVRELVALPIRAVVFVVFAVPVFAADVVVTTALRGIPMVVAVVVATVAGAIVMWRVLDSDAGRLVLARMSLHDSLAGSRQVALASEHGLPTVGPAALHDRLSRLALRTWMPLSLFLLYWLGTLGWQWPNPDRTWLPPAYEVWQSLNSFWWFERFGSDIVPSLWTIALGIGVTIAVGIALGVLIGTSRRLTEVVRPLLDFIRSIPKILLITPIVAIAGSGATTSVIVIISGALWPLLLGTLDGIAGIHPAVDDVARTYRISRRDKYVKMIIPAAAPNIFAGLRTSVSIGVILLVVVQSIGEARGIGYHLRAENEAFKYDNMWAAAAMLAGLGYLLNVIVSWFEARFLHWFYAKGTDV
ncbi:MAG: ABC transporter permease subunit [Actinomycetota bacterium]